jgi:hypothetical protein
MDRQGNTLSTAIRAAWDNGTLRIMTKNSPATATDAHISIVGHITKDELLRYLNQTESCNGLGNRFLWVCVRRSKLLPEGGNLTDEMLQPIADRVACVLAFARGQDEIRRDPGARELWAAIYPKLSEGRPGLLGAITGRSEAQAMRLALVYALLDGSSVIREKHLLAGLGAWDYCLSSAKYIFGNAVGDPVADGILRALESRPDGMPRTEISALFGRHQSHERITQAIGMLQENNRIRLEVERTPGRNAERIYLCNYNAK